MDELVAGVIFWQWGFAPYVAEEFLQGCIHCQAIQVSSSDGVFKNIIAPAAEHAAQVALSRSPVAGCKSGMGGMLPCTATCCIATCCIVTGCFATGCVATGCNVKCCSPLL